MKNKKIIILIFLGILLFGISSSLSYLLLKKDKVNELVLGVVDAQVNEEFSNNIKSNVYITNTGNVNEYVRVSIVVYYTDLTNNVLLDKPIKNTDYTINLSSSDNWFKASDGYYYYKNELLPNENTDNLIDNIKEINNTDDKNLNVDIVVQAIQSNDSNAIKESWNATVENSVVTKD